MLQNNDHSEHMGAAEKLHASWLGDFLHNIQDINYDFPLSGGEHGQPVLYHGSLENEVEIMQPFADYNGEIRQHGSWYALLFDRIRDLDTDFPLSGGEHA